LRRIGVDDGGVMGAVFEVEDLDADRADARYALKVVPRRSTIPDATHLRRRFAEELRAASALGSGPAGAPSAQNPSAGGGTPAPDTRAPGSFFVRIYASDNTDPNPYLLMEYLDSWKTLSALLRDERALSSIEVARLGVAILRGVERMGHVRIIHRDLKPENIFVKRITEGFLVKIGDLGGACDDQTAHGTNVQPVGDFIGSPGYVSPEHYQAFPNLWPWKAADADDYKLGPKADVFSAGCVLWTAACGQPPFAEASANTPEAVKAWWSAVSQPPALPASMHPRLYNMLLRALSPKPSDRCSVGELRQWLAGFSAEREVWELSDKLAKAATLYDEVRVIYEGLAAPPSNLGAEELRSALAQAKKIRSKIADIGADLGFVPREDLEAASRGKDAAEQAKLENETATRKALEDLKRAEEDRERLDRQILNLHRSRRSRLVAGMLVGAVGVAVLSSIAMAARRRSAQREVVVLPPLSLHPRCAESDSDACLAVGRELVKSGNPAEALPYIALAALQNSSAKPVLELLEQTANAPNAQGAALEAARACTQNQPLGCFVVALLQRAALGTKAQAALSERCDAGEAKACAGLGVAVRDGSWGIARDDERARKLFQWACDGDSSQGCFELGRYPFTGYHT
jgi:serine/threonine protein kinase